MKNLIDFFPEMLTENDATKTHERVLRSVWKQFVRTEEKRRALEAGELEQGGVTKAQRSAVTRAENRLRIAKQPFGLTMNQNIEWFTIMQNEPNIDPVTAIRRAQKVT